MTDHARAIIDFAYNDQGKEVRDSFYAAVYDKVTAHIEAKKQEIAGNLIQPPTLDLDKELESDEVA